MKLNYDCIRDIMITIEKQTLPMHMTLTEFSALLPQYSHTELTYSCWKLNEAGYLILYTFIRPGSSEKKIRLIGDLTYKGHQFLADIKPAETWKILSPALKKVGSASFQTIQNVAGILTADAIKLLLDIANR